MASGSAGTGLAGGGCRAGLTASGASDVRVPGDAEAGAAADVEEGEGGGGGFTTAWRFSPPHPARSVANKRGRQDLNLVTKRIPWTRGFLRRALHPPGAPEPILPAPLKQGQHLNSNPSVNRLSFQSDAAGICRRLSDGGLWRASLENGPTCTAAGRNDGGLAWPVP